MYYGLVPAYPAHASIMQTTGKGAHTPGRVPAHGLRHVPEQCRHALPFRGVVVQWGTPPRQRSNGVVRRGHAAPDHRIVLQQDPCLLAAGVSMNADDVVAWLGHQHSRCVEEGLRADESGRPFRNTSTIKKQIVPRYCKMIDHNSGVCHRCIV